MSRKRHGDGRKKKQTRCGNCTKRARLGEPWGKLRRQGFVGCNVTGDMRHASDEPCEDYQDTRKRGQP